MRHFWLKYGIPKEMYTRTMQGGRRKINSEAAAMVGRFMWLTDSK